MINKVILTGRITSDIELRRTNDGTPYCFFTLAVNRRQADKTDFISCTAWRQTAELMNQYLTKGALIGVEGRLDVYTKNEDGKFESRTNVVVEQLTFLESKAQADARNAATGQTPNGGPMTFAKETTVDQSQSTPVPEQTESFGSKSTEEINAQDISIDDIKF